MLSPKQWSGGRSVRLLALLLLAVGVCTETASAEDMTCFELPVVIVSPTKVKLPTETCNQPRFPAKDCLKWAVDADIEVIDNEEGTLNCLGGNRTAVYPGSAHYRGQSSLHFSKHQLAVNLDKDEELLGFPADRSYVLNGPTIDGSLMRNHLAHWMFRGTGRYSPRTRHVVVFIRDRLDALDWSPRYRGIYLAMEKIAYTPNRVGLAAMSNVCQTEEDLSGGWAWQNNPLGYGEYSPNLILDEPTSLFGSGARPILTFPKPKALTQTMRDYFVDPKTGPLPRLYQYLYANMTQPDDLEEHLDVGSFVDYLLHSELSTNSDAYRRSTYFFKDRGQPINAGPVWDFNLAYGTGASMTAWMYKGHTFWKRLACNYKFAALVPKRWAQLRSTTWSDESIRSFVKEGTDPLRRQLAKCHNWKSEDLQCANLDVKTGTFESHVDAMQAAVLERALWMDENVAGFFQSLDHDVCVTAGELPAYNCAADGDDSGCLDDPESYSAAVEFPEPRKAFAGASCKELVKSRPDASLAETELPSIDPCWLSAGVYMTEGSITPFCSGYGACPSGPGATCTCSSGRRLPTCARSDDTIVPRGGFPDHYTTSMEVETSSDEAYPHYTGFFFLCGFLAVAVVGTVVARGHKRRQYREITRLPVENSPISSGRRFGGEELAYGT